MNFTYVSQTKRKKKKRKKTKNWNWNQNEINIRKEKENPRAEIHTNQKSKRNNNKNLAGVPQKSNGSSACFPPLGCRGGTRGRKVGISDSPALSSIITTRAHAGKPGEENSQEEKRKSNGREGGGRRMWPRENVEMGKEKLLLFGYFFSAIPRTKGFRSPKLFQ